jgi:hypothetical protein
MRQRRRHPQALRSAAARRQNINKPPIGSRFGGTDILASIAICLHIGLPSRLKEVDRNPII